MLKKWTKNERNRISLSNICKNILKISNNAYNYSQRKGKKYIFNLKHGNGNVKEASGQTLVVLTIERPQLVNKHEYEILFHFIFLHI